MTNVERALEAWRNAAELWNLAHGRCEQQRLVVLAAVDTYAQAMEKKVELRLAVAEAEAELIKLRVPRDRWAAS